jgi:hypothetical protein
VARGPAGETAWRAAHVLEAPTLFQAVPLTPARPLATAAVAYLEVPDAASFRAVLRANLLLGNDQLRCLALAGGALVHIARPSAFLLAKWADQPAWRRYRPCPAEPRLLVPWDREFPLPAKLGLLPPSGAPELWLLADDAPWRCVQGAFSDVYDRIVVDPAGLALEPLTAVEAPRLLVELRLAPTEATDRARLWRLSAADRGVLDRLLQEAGEAELEHLALAALRDAAGEPVLMLLDTLPAAAHPSAGSHAPALLEGGQAWYARLPDEHLYLPVGQRLAPWPSRGSLIAALGLRDDRLTLLTPRADGKVGVVRVPRAAFTPLGALLDYQTADAAEELAALLAEVRFDFDLAADPLGPATPEAKGGFWRRWLGR